MNDYLKELFIEEAKKALESRKAGGITPTGAIDITENGEFDVTEFAKAIVDVASSGGDTGNTLDQLIDGSITEITSNVASIGKYAFYSCNNLITASFPNAISVGENAFSTSTSGSVPVLTTVYLPKATTLSSNVFMNSAKLKNIYIPLVESMGDYCFGSGSTKFYNNALEKLDCSKLLTIGDNCFRYCSNFKTFVIRNETMCTVTSTNAFTNSAIAKNKGYIYVPRSLVESYQSATNWSTYASQFRALEDYTVDGTITGELDESKI